ncbi:MAG: hypothetical protein WBE97_14250 [Candidatus Acidiferrales bacterium]
MNSTLKTARSRSWSVARVAAFVLLSSLAATSQTSPTASALPAGLPDVLTMPDGSRVTSRGQLQKWRAEWQKFFTEQMYGQAPLRPAAMRFIVADDTPDALSGTATRKQVTILLSGDAGGPALHLLLYIPKHVRRPPVILGLNFWGNQAVNADPGIFLSQNWVESEKNPWVDLSCVQDHRATAACRGINASQWPVETILQRGYALATVYRGDVDPDRKDGFAESLRAYYPELQNRPDNFSTIGAWAWALSRVMDYLQTDADVDAARVAVFGWSRLGKAALWAGATDQRFAMVISNESGAGGAKLFRRDVGETILQLNTNFPYWYCANFKQYDGHDAALPFDQHIVIAMIAPRPVYIASAIENAGADPEGEFLAAVAAGPVYRMLGTDGLPTTQWPPVNHSVAGQIGYHVRSGGHDVTAYDWQQFLNFADEHLKASAGVVAP